jgi:2-oxoglutarate ferredoxin oxidoreductase subunit alpha
VDKQLMRGNHVVAEAAIRAGCKCYFGYPITPQNEICEYMSENLPKYEGRTFIQAESELAAINMVLGAAVTGARVMTSSSSPGISLKQEGISFLAGQELPAVIVNMTRGGPGLGNIAPSQSDYFQATRGGGHGDYRTTVLAPSSVQEIADLTFLAFDLADKYRNPVVILGDGLLGQMMEPVVFQDPVTALPEKEWALTGSEGRPSRLSRSLILDTREMEEHNWKLHRKYEIITKNEIRYETQDIEDAKIIMVAYGVAARIARGAIKRARREGIPIGLIRPITLWPFPYDFIKQVAANAPQFLVFEMNTGQMVEDVKLALEGRGNLHFYGRPGGAIPTPVELGWFISRNFYQAQKQGLV